MTRTLLTVGHGAADRERLGELLTGAGVALVVDVRRYPASRTNPDVRREALERWLPERGVDYRWEPRLGGRRHTPAGTPEPDTWWTVPAFRAYAAYTRTPDFSAALDDVLADAGTRTTAVMCSESVWWRCHRRLIADVAVLGHDVPVRHLMPDGRTVPHRPADGARRGPDATVHWDG
ncbi:DUF488 family protein [Micromonospora halophytica]|uniref:DUF488 domain-containing protein n=1 Tax=Micromonospora halophytica TaxID=47864 RepID=A0A1C5HZN0_9ACTN|nr:DUF488 domain-containing protein [Micromonospora halophytica]SCG51454.1 Protein of unknown function, DUF488 [Micromonospora halophytica]